MTTTASPDESRGYEKSRRATLLALEKIDQETLVKLSRLTLPEIRALRQEIARVLPVGNLPAFVLDGLLKLKGRTVNVNRVKRDLIALFQGTKIVSQGLYSAFVVGPATVLYAYQKLLQLAGQDLQAAFPEGTWQFYLQFGLREDAARHTNETLGFAHAIPEHDPLDAAATWVWAIANFIFDYHDLLAVDWIERVSLRILNQVAAEAGQGEAPPLAQLVRDWNARRPYTRPNTPASEAPSLATTYLSYRRALFKTFLNERLVLLPGEAVQAFQAHYQDQAAAELRAYQDQMSLLCALTPERYQEEREPIPVWRARVGFIWGGRTFLIPICQRDSQGRPLCYPPHPGDANPIPLRLTAGGGLAGPDGRPVIVNQGGWVYKEKGASLSGRLRAISPEQIKGQLAVILDTWSEAGAGAAYKNTPPLDLLLAESPRAQQAELRAALPETTQVEVVRARLAPVILNWDQQPSDAPLSYIRRGQRGIGDHALTIFRTARGFVLDQSHIFFDGLWGMAVAELLTNEAIYRYPQMARAHPRPPISAPRPLKLVAPPETVEQILKVRFLGEAAAESAEIQTQRLTRLRRWLSQRGVRLTVNDLLLLYRYLYAGAHRPSRPAHRAIEAFRTRANSDAERAAVRAIDECLTQMRTTNPALLIPMDASNVAPRERIFPTTFRNPLVEINSQIAATHKAHQAYQKEPSPDNWATFDHIRREMLAHLQAFGELLDALKAVTMRGESFNTATIRMLAHLPASMQNLLDQIPQRIGVLNEIIKGTEVFSNVGRVASGSSLSRFSSARDDGQTKWLVWGVLTDDEGVMRITLRDFRPFVSRLLQLNDPKARDLADLLTRDYLEGYVKGFNRFVAKLGAVVSEERPAQL